MLCVFWRKCFKFWITALTLVPSILSQSNPFRKRICNVFSTSEHKDGSLTFEDFLDLLSAFSDSATLEIKSHYAFRIFGKYLIKNISCFFNSTCKAFNLCIKHIDIFRFRWWWNSWLWWSGEAGKLPDWWDRWHKTNIWRNETAYQQCEFTEASPLWIYREAHYIVKTARGYRYTDLSVSWTVVSFECFLDSWRVRHRQGWDCEPLRVSACHFKVTRFCQVTRSWITFIMIYTLLNTIWFTLTASIIFWFLHSSFKIVLWRPLAGCGNASPFNSHMVFNFHLEQF